MNREELLTKARKSSNAELEKYGLQKGLIYGFAAGALILTVISIIEFMAKGSVQIHGFIIYFGMLSVIYFNSYKTSEIKKDLVLGIVCLIIFLLFFIGFIGMNI